MAMWRLYFEICDFLVGFIPNRRLREKIRCKELYDYRKKYNALRMALPRSEFKHVRIIKGGWNIGFIVNNKCVCKIRKFYDKNLPFFVHLNLTNFIVLTTLAICATIVLLN